MAPRLTQVGQQVRISDDSDQVVAAFARDPRGDLPLIVNGGSLAVFNVATQYGAKGDGVTDDTAAIQAAVTDAIAVDGIVYFPDPASYYRTTDTITLQPVSGAQFRCSFMGGSDPFAIRYEGANGKAVFRSYGWVASDVRNINVRVNTATDCIVWDIDVDTTRNSTNHLNFHNCRAYVGDGNNNVGWRLGHTGGGGTEMSFNNWFDCSVEAGTGAGTGQLGWVSEHSNGLAMCWWNCVGYSLDKAFTNTSTSGAGSAQGGDTMGFFGCGGSGNSVDFEFKTTGIYWISGGRFELGKKFLVIGNGSTHLAVGIKGVKLGNYSPADNCVIDWANITYNGGRPGNLTIEDLVADGADYTAAFLTYQGAATRPSRLTIRGGGIRSTLAAPATPVTLVSDALAGCVVEGVQQLNSSNQSTALLGMPSRTVASAATITVPPETELVTVTGTTTITSVTAGRRGQRVTLYFSGALTFTDGSNLLLAGNLVTTADDTISLICDGTNWIETARSVN